jgi:hypothetical protein
LAINQAEFSKKYLPEEKKDLPPQIPDPAKTNTAFSISDC